MLVTHRNTGRENRTYKPTRRDIRQACAEIQARWSVRERNKRAGRDRNSSWTPPRVRLSAILEAVDDDRTERAPYLASHRDGDVF